MSNQYLKLRRSNVQGRIPTTESIDFGEIALNTFDGLAYMKKSGSNGIEVVPIGSSTGSFTGNFTGTFTGSLQGTASWAENYNETDPIFTAVSGTFATTSSFNAFTASYNTGSFTGSFVGSLEGTSSWAQSASYAPNIYNTDGILTGDRSVDISNYQLNIGSGSYRNLEIINANNTGSVVVRNSLYISGAPSGSALPVTYLSGSEKFPQLTIEAVYPDFPLERFQIKAGGYGTNTWFGAEAMQNVVRQGAGTGTQNDAFGFRALQNLTTGLNNTAFGGWALGDTTTGTRNAAVGLDALWRNVIGSRNTGIGTQAGQDNISGSRNIYIGDNAGRGILSGSNNIIIGTQTGLPAGLSDNIIISIGAGTTRARSFETGNWLFQNGGVFVDSGFRLDVNGTVRAQDSLYVPVSNSIISNGAGLNIRPFGTGGNTITMGNGNIIIPGDQSYSFFGRATISSPSANNLLLTNSNNFSGLYFGAVTGSLPSLRIGTRNIAIVSGDGTGSSSLLVGTTTDISSSILTLVSTTRGLLPPRMTEAQRIAISNPASGLIVYETGSVVTEGLWLNETTGWHRLLTNTGSQSINGSLTAISFTGSLQGTASWARNAITASYVLNAVSASHAETASYAQTASYLINAKEFYYTASAPSGSFITTGSLWIDSDSGYMFAYIDDGSDKVWIQPTVEGEQGPIGLTGPQGPVGPQGPTGSSQPFSFVGNDTWATTSSLQVTGSLTISGSSTFTNIGPAAFIGSVSITGSTTQTGNNTLIGNTVLSGSIGISGSSTIQGTTTMSGSLSISGSTTQTGNNTLIGTTTLTGSIFINGDIIPEVSSSFDLGSLTNPWRSIYVQSGSISIQSDIPGGIPATISNANGNVTFAGAGFQLKSGSFVPFEISSSARTIIRVPNIPAGDVGGLSIIGSSDGSYQGVTNAGGLLHLTSNDGQSSRITSDAFGTTAVASYVGRKARGTAASPLPVQAGDTLTRISTIGWTGPEYGFLMSASSAVASTAIETVALENFTTSSFGTKHTFYNAPLGGTIRTLSTTIDTTGITIPSSSRLFGTASWAINAQTASYINPLNQNVIITGSLRVSGSLTEIGDTVLSGSLTLSSGSALRINNGFYVDGNRQFNYGQFSSTQTQSGSADTAYSATFNTTDFAQGVSLVSQSRITVANTGIYNIQFSSQLHTTANQAVDFSIWFAMTGSNIANSNTDFTVEKIAGGGYMAAALNFLTRIASGSYVELKYSKTTTQGQLQAKETQATPTRPATPSVILTVTQVA
jgi:hypothetical protein